MKLKTLLTADEFESMPNDDSVRSELDEGELITMPFAGGQHGYITAEIACELWGFVKKHKLGRAYGPGTGFRSATTGRGDSQRGIREGRSRLMKPPDCCPVSQ
jgi:Uma2 family endonuclease